MKSKGFTLVEILGIVAILALIAIIAVPAVVNMNKNSEKKNYQRFIKDLEIATENYITLNPQESPTMIGGKTFVTISSLINKGYIKSNLVNPNTNEVVSPESTIMVTKQSNGINKYDFCEENCSVSGYIQDGLLVQYDGFTAPKDNLWQDTSGNNIHGTLMNFTGDYYDGSGIIYDGVDDYIELGNQLINLYKNSVTFEIVVNFDGNKTRSVFLGNYPDANNINIEKGYEARQARIWYKNGTINYFTPNDFLTLEKTKNYTFTLDKPNKTFYFYDAASLKYQVTNNEFANNYDFTNARIGSDRCPDRQVVTLKGKIYAVRIYNRKLTEKEIQHNYELDQKRFDLTNN